MLLVLAIAGLFVLPTPWSVIAVCVAAAIEVGELYMWRWYLHRHRIKVGAEALVGERATVITACAPDGRVRMRGELWRARCSTPLEAGAEARVAAVDGLTLELVPASGEGVPGTEKGP